MTVAGTSPPRHGVWRWQDPLRQGPAECLPEPGGHVAVPPCLCAESASSFARNNAFQRTTLRDYLLPVGRRWGLGVIMSPGDAWQCLETFVTVSTGGGAAAIHRAQDGRSAPKDNGVEAGKTLVWAKPSRLDTRILDGVHFLPTLCPERVTSDNPRAGGARSASHVCP